MTDANTVTDEQKELAYLRAEIGRINQWAVDYYRESRAGLLALQRTTDHYVKEAETDKVHLAESIRRYWGLMDRAIGLINALAPMYTIDRTYGTLWTANPTEQQIAAVVSKVSELALYIDKNPRPR